MTAAVLRAMLLAAVVPAFPAALAQGGLADPTRPPSAAAAQGGPDEATPGGRQLQSVLLSGGRRIAVIDGNMVALGGMLGEARVVKITETEVVLKTGEETEILKLFPGVDKKTVKRPARRAQAGAPAEGSTLQGGSK
jgi:MSHA biogenesis protein MshK